MGWRGKAWGGGGRCGQGRDIGTWEEHLVAGSENLSALKQIVPFVVLAKPACNGKGGFPAEEGCCWLRPLEVGQP